MTHEHTPAPRAPLALHLVLAQCEAASSAEVLETLAAQLLHDGVVSADFPRALAEREAAYPTGLPTPIPTAIPHADPQHVQRPGLALATLAQPVAFGEMAAPGREVAVRLVAMPLLTDAREHLAALQRLMGVLRDEQLVTQLLAAPDDASLRALAEQHLTGEQNA
ncbi:PTS sugar transporter subunit IIA [Brachybacterium sp. UMB0905]|uniref:PTS sugar transporter subunit IIA n=1 Tax=Brachybacterium sp. UMB0905 TaxID=2069310 RepID=UPI000C8091D3|nr:PTS sugar transporter subunit IIA [Brachybacterium sp. UMB0905]PMC74876.1 PTS fructose transporter subunit IIA [Brachybacterium sp. UMB0905]